jgi:hypothetical protein
MGLHQIKKLLHSKGNNQQSEDSSQNGRKSLPAINPTGLIHKIYKEMLKADNKRTSNPVNN